MTEEQFAAWLVARGFAEDRAGYGHATGGKIAEELFADGFKIIKGYTTGTVPF